MRIYCLTVHKVSNFIFNFVKPTFD
ncbi:hypothetical protein FAF33_006905 [Staphylococcus haemolyticus]|nr:hypothetical protein FAF33_006905 [Staphylococcus haemolyticus]